MPRAPRITATELLKALARLGWEERCQRGSHVQLRHPQRSDRVTVPIHAGEIIRLRLLASIVRPAGISLEELRNAL